MEVPSQRQIAGPLAWTAEQRLHHVQGQGLLITCPDRSSRLIVISRARGPTCRFPSAKGHGGHTASPRHDKLAADRRHFASARAWGEGSRCCLCPAGPHIEILGWSRPARPEWGRLLAYSAGHHCAWAVQMRP